MCQCGCIISSIYVWPGGRKVDYLSFSSKHKECCQMNWKIDPTPIMMPLWASCVFFLVWRQILWKLQNIGQSDCNKLKPISSGFYFFIFLCSNMKHLGHFNVGHHSTLFKSNYLLMKKYSKSQRNRQRCPSQCTTWQIFVRAPSALS